MGLKTSQASIYIIFLKSKVGANFWSLSPNNINYCQLHPTQNILKDHLFLLIIFYGVLQNVETFCTEIVC